MVATYKQTECLVIDNQDNKKLQTKRQDFWMCENGMVQKWSNSMAAR